MLLISCQGAATKVNFSQDLCLSVCLYVKKEFLPAFSLFSPYTMLYTLLFTILYTILYTMLFTMLYTMVYNMLYTMLYTVLDTMMYTSYKVLLVEGEEANFNPCKLSSFQDLVVWLVKNACYLKYSVWFLFLCEGE